MEYLAVIFSGRMQESCIFSIVFICFVELSLMQEGSFLAFAFTQIWEFVQITHIGLSNSSFNGSRAQQIHSNE